MRQWETLVMPSVSGVCVGEWSEERWEQGPPLCALTVNLSNDLNKCVNAKSRIAPLLNFIEINSPSFIRSSIPS